MRFVSLISEDATNAAILQNFPEDTLFFKYYLVLFFSLLSRPGLVLIFGPKTKGTTLASVESHKDRSTGFKITAAELSVSDGSQSFLQALCVQQLCGMKTALQELHTSKSAQLHSLPFGCFPSPWKERVLATLPEGCRSPAWVHTAALPLALGTFLFFRCRREELSVAKYDIIFGTE